MLDNFLMGFTQLASVAGLLACLAGALLGTLVGVLPGLSAGAMAALMLPLLPMLPLDLSLVLFSSLLYGAQYGGSLGAILLGVPGEASSTISVVEGHALAQRGLAKQAIRASTVASFIAGLMSTFVLAALATYAIGALKVSAFHQLLLVVGASALFVLMSRQALAAATVAVSLGVLLSFVVAGGPKRASVVPLPGGGLDLASVAIALFGLAEAVRSLLSRAGQAPQPTPVTSQEPEFPLNRVIPPALRGGALGLLGGIPGFTFTLLTTLAYVLETVLGKRKDFGDGAIESLVAPEAANNSAAQGSVGAALLFGLPSGPVAAMMVGFMQKQGLEPGPAFVAQAPAVVWALMASFLVVNVFLLLINYYGIAPLTGLLKLSRRKLDLTILVASLLGLALLAQDAWQLFPAALAVAAAAYWLKRQGVCLVTMFVGCVLGSLAQTAHFGALKAGYPSPATLIWDPWVAVPVSCLLLGALLRPSVRAVGHP